MVVGAMHWSKEMMLCLVCACWCHAYCQGWTWPSTLPGDGFSSSLPALLAMPWGAHPPKPSSLRGPSFCCNKEQYLLGFPRKGVAVLGAAALWSSPPSPEA